MTKLPLEFQFITELADLADEKYLDMSFVRDEQGDFYARVEFSDTNGVYSAILDQPKMCMLPIIAEDGRAVKYRKETVEEYLKRIRKLMIAEMAKAHFNRQGK